MKYDRYAYRALFICASLLFLVVVLAFSPSYATVATKDIKVGKETADIASESARQSEELGDLVSEMTEVKRAIGDADLGPIVDLNTQVERLNEMLWRATRMPRSIADAIAEKSDPDETAQALSQVFFGIGTTLDQQEIAQAHRAEAVKASTINALILIKDVKERLPDIANDNQSTLNTLETEGVSVRQQLFVLNKLISLQNEIRQQEIAIRAAEAEVATLKALQSLNNDAAREFAGGQQ